MLYPHHDRTLESQHALIEPTAVRLVFDNDTPQADKQGQTLEEQTSANCGTMEPK